MLSRLSIRAKLYAGFGVTLALTGLLAAYSFYGALKAGGDFDHYQSASRQSVSYSELSKYALQARLAGMKFRSGTGDDSDLAAVKASMAQIIETEKQLDDMQVSESERKDLKEITEAANNYIAGFEKAAALQSKRNALVDSNLYPVGTEIRKLLTEIMGSAYRDNDVKAAFYAARAQQHVLLARSYVQEYLIENEKDDRDRTGSEIQTAANEINTLLSELENPARRELAQNAQRQLEAYSSAFKQIAELTTERNAIYQAQLDTLGPRILELTSEIMKAQIAEQTQIEPVISGEFKSQEVVSAALGGLVVALGVLIAYLLARALANPIVSMTSAMRNLANNDTAVSIPSLDRADEIG
ncbi:MAG: HAMP domain-containing protein, partial [Rhodomicrobium sp.]|nr:HAMP domain-containing protein [Rhodomicrobium sp.]